MRGLKKGADKLIYLPVIAGKGGWMSSKKVTRNLYGADLGWWMRDPVYKYDAVLMSAYYGLENEVGRKEMEMRDDVVFFGDSGGFQIFNLGWNNPQRFKELTNYLTPEKVVTWQQKNCDIGMTLDNPLPDFHAYDRATFEKHLDVSKKNGDKMAGMIEDKDFQLFSVVHGRNLDDITEWWKETTIDYDFSGFSLDAGNLRTVAMDLGFAIENLNGAPFHILGASGFQSILLMAYANQYMKTALYYDSSTYNTGNTLRKYIIHYDIAGSGILLNEKDPKSYRPPSRLGEITCPCPICRALAINDDTSKLWEEGTMSGTLITLHNLFWFNNFSETLDQLIHHAREYFDEFARKFARPQTRKYMDFIDDTVDIGLDKAWSKHFEGATQKVEDWY